MTKLLRRLSVAVPIVLIATAGTAPAGTVKRTPVKGATYAGLVQGAKLTVKIDRKGKTASVSLPFAPAYCSSGASPEPHSSKPASISKSGAMTAKITFRTGGLHPQTLATVTVQGHFFTFSGAKPVFQGTVKSSFSFAGTADCSGQQSVQAVKR